MWVLDELAEDEDYSRVQKRMPQTAWSSSTPEENRLFLGGFLASAWGTPSQRALPDSTEAHQRSQKDKEKTYDAKSNLPSALEERKINKRLKIGLWEEMRIIPIKEKAEESVSWILNLICRWRY